MSDMAVMPRGSGEEVGNERKSASDCAGEVASSRESFDHLRYSSLASAGVGNGADNVTCVIFSRGSRVAFMVTS